MLPSRAGILQPSTALLLLLLLAPWAVAGKSSSATRSPPPAVHHTHHHHRSPPPPKASPPAKGKKPSAAAAARPQQAKRPPPPPRLRHSPPPPPSPSPLLHTQELVYIGCFADDAQHDVGEVEWQAAVARGRVGVSKAQCAQACSDTAWFALQDGYCQCVQSFGSAPQYKQVADADCGGADGSGAALPARNAIYTQTDCWLGGQVELLLKEDLGRSIDGQNQWRARVRIQHWQAGALVTLDWGALAIEVYSMWNAQVSAAAPEPRVVQAWCYWRC